MKITREKACQRLHHRVSTPLNVVIDGSEYAVADWSLGGLRLRAWQDFSHTEVGDTLACHFSLPFQGFDIAFNTDIEVVRTMPADNELAARFISLDDRQTELMNHFIEQLVRGAMVPIDDTILRIDSPVTPVSTKPDPSPVEEVPVSRWPTKLIGMSVFYFLLGSLVFYLMGVTVYRNFMSLQVAHAVTEKPIEPIISLTDGRIISVSVGTRDQVQAGQSLFQIVSPDLTQRIKEARVDLEKTKLELETLRKKHAVVVDIHKSHLVKEARFLEIEIDEKQQDIALATERLLSLHEHKDDLQIASPNQGRIVKVMRSAGSIVKKGDTLALFEHNEQLRVAAYLTQEDAAYLSLEARAVVHSALYGTSWDAVITAIEPIEPITNKFVTDERSMRVELSLLDDASELPSGTPVHVEFPATKINSLFRTTTRNWSDDVARQRTI